MNEPVDVRHSVWDYVNFGVYNSVRFGIHSPVHFIVDFDTGHEISSDVHFTLREELDV